MPKANGGMSFLPKDEDLMSKYIPATEASEIIAMLARERIQLYIAIFANKPPDKS